MLKKQTEKREDIILYRRVLFITFSLQFAWYFVGQFLLKWEGDEVVTVTGLLVILNTFFIVKLLRLCDKKIFLTIIIAFFFLVTGVGMGYLSILIFAYVLFTTRKRGKDLKKRE